MNNTTLKEQYFEGRDSGYPLCCIIFFIIRLLIFFFTGKLAKIPTEKGFRHVPCYWCRLFPVKAYSKCENCNWTQYNNSICNKCLNCKHRFVKNGPMCLKCDYHRPAKFAEYRFVSEDNEYIIVSERYE